MICTRPRPKARRQRRRLRGFVTFADAPQPRTTKRRLSELERLERDLARATEEYYGEALRANLQVLTGNDLEQLHQLTREYRELPAAEQERESIGELVRRMTVGLQREIPAYVQPQDRDAWLRQYEARIVRHADALDTILKELHRLGAVEMSQSLLREIRGEAPAPAPEPSGEAGLIPREELDALFNPERLDVELDAEAIGESIKAAQQVAEFDVASKIALTVGAGLEQGLTDGQIADRLATRLPLVLQREAFTFARTESTRYYNLGREALADQAGDYVWGYEYRVILDKRTTRLCRGFAGHTVAKAELQHRPPLHYNCRTVLHPILSERVGGPKNPKTTLPKTARPDDGFAGRESATSRTVPRELPPIGAGGGEANVGRGPAEPVSVGVVELA